MIDSAKIVAIINEYKEYFPTHWENEKYKWEAVKHFQDNWDINADNFGEMFKKATDKTSNLLASGYAYPRGMILEFAKADDNAVRNLFINLFDENIDLAERVEAFIKTSEEIRVTYDNGTWKNHYQNTNAISTYLWLMYPDKYYIYKYELYKAVASELDDTYMPKRNGSALNMVQGFQMYDDICTVLNQNSDIRNMLENALTDTCYPDADMKTLTIDFGFYIARFYEDRSPEVIRCWFVGAYSNTDDMHYDEEFVAQGIWQNGYTDKFLDTVNSVKVGDKIAIKTSYTKKNDLPFDNHGETISVMYIKTVGTVTANRQDGRTLEVDWDTSYQPKEWYFYTFRNTITLPKEDDWRTKALIDFVFHDVPQDYEKFMGTKDDDVDIADCWLLTWNPKNYDWENAEEQYNYDTMISAVKNSGAYIDCWRCVSKKVKAGDRIFIMKLGAEPKGIIATGYAIGDSFDGTYTDDSGSQQKESLIDICITEAIDYRTEEILSQKTLKEIASTQQWSPQGSGISIRQEAAVELLRVWNSIKRNSSEMATETDVITLSASNSEFLKYFAPLIQALKELGGSAARKEAHEKVIELMGISEEELSVTYEKTGASRVLNQIDFARNDLAHEGFISNGTKGVWALTELGMNIDMTMELAGLIHMKWVKINTARRKGEPIPEIDLSAHYKKKIDLKYTKEDFLKQVFLTESEYDKLRSLVLRKKNIILQGAPGVGKTFSAKRLAYSIIGEQNENRICMVQFHQNYSYEDFIMGYRPNDSGGFEIQSGVFYNFCARCKENPDDPYFFIIDEINRGNLSKIFGELLMLIEADKRGEEHKLNLVYGRELFYIPKNLHIIGMMNTADRSLAMIDYALRRRFSFYTMNPAFDSAELNGFGEYIKDIDCVLYHTVFSKIKELNNEIRNDSTLGKGFEIGHSYFAPEKKSDIDDEWMRNVVQYEIIPLIEEYWFDNDKKTDEWKKTLYQTLGEEYDG